MTTTRPPYERHLTFEIRLRQADDALGALASGLRARNSDVALGDAIRARAAVRAAYRAWEAVDDAHRSAATLIALRYRGHHVLSVCLREESNEKLVRTVADGSHAELIEHASTLALLAVLWKVADALDEIEDADAA